MSKKQDPILKFDNEDEIKKAAQEFQSLIRQAGWSRLHDFFHEKLKYFDWYLREGDIKSLEDLRIIRARRDLTENFLNLPELILEILKKSNGEGVSFDPYSAKKETMLPNLDPYDRPEDMNPNKVDIISV